MLPPGDWAATASRLVVPPWVRVRPRRSYSRIARTVGLSPQRVNQMLGSK